MSDVDLLVEMEPGRSMLDFVGLWQDLQELLGTSVDLVSEGGSARIFGKRSSPKLSRCERRSRLPAACA